MTTTTKKPFLVPIPPCSRKIYTSAKSQVIESGERLQVVTRAKMSSNPVRAMVVKMPPKVLTSSRASTIKNVSSSNGYRRTTSSAGQTRTTSNSIIDISGSDDSSESADSRGKRPSSSQADASDDTRQSKRPRTMAQASDITAQERQPPKDSKVDIPLEQWLWSDTQFTDALVPNLCFYIRVCTRTSRMELVEKFGGSMKVLKSLSFADLGGYELQESFKHLGGDRSEAYVHLKPTSGVGDSITLKLSKDRNYDFLLTTIRTALKT